MASQTHECGMPFTVARQISIRRSVPKAVVGRRCSTTNLGSLAFSPRIRFPCHRKRRKSVRPIWLAEDGEILFFPFLSYNMFERALDLDGITTLGVRTRTLRPRVDESTRRQTCTWNIGPLKALGHLVGEFAPLSAGAGVTQRLSSLIVVAESTPRFLFVL